MTCDVIRLPGGGTAIVCHRRRAAPRCQINGCARPGVRQCDFAVGPGRTCDRFLCSDYAVRQGRDCDYCPDHPLDQGDLFAPSGRAGREA